MGDIMYTIDRIEDGKVILEDRETKEMIILDIDNFPLNIKEGDIIDKVNDEYVINIEKTERIRNNIRDKFNSLLN